MRCINVKLAIAVAGAFSVCAPAAAQEKENKKFLWEATTKFVVMTHDFEDKLFSEGVQNSELNFDSNESTGIEFTLKSTHQRTGLFLRGTAAYSRKYTGAVIDEDFISPDFAALLDVPFSELTEFFPAGGTFSKTISDLGDTNNFYFGADAGVTFGSDRVRFSPFIGYFFLRDVYEAFGSQILEDDTDNFFFGPPGLIEIPLSDLVVREQVTWRGFRIGFDVSADIAKRWFVDISASGMPGVGRLRNPNDFPFSDFGGENLPTFFISSNNAFSAMIDGSVGFRLTPSISLVAGGRYWRFGSGQADIVVGPTLPPEEQEFAEATNNLRAFGGNIGLKFIF